MNRIIASSSRQIAPFPFVLSHSGSPTAIIAVGLAREENARLGIENKRLSLFLWRLNESAKTTYGIDQLRPFLCPMYDKRKIEMAE